MRAQETLSFVCMFWMASILALRMISHESTCILLSWQPWAWQSWGLNIDSVACPEIDDFKRRGWVVLRATARGYVPDIHSVIHICVHTPAPELNFYSLNRTLAQSLGVRTVNNHIRISWVRCGYDGQEKKVSDSDCGGQDIHNLKTLKRKILNLPPPSSCSRLRRSSKFWYSVWRLTTVLYVPGF